MSSLSSGVCNLSFAQGPDSVHSIHNGVVAPSCSSEDRKLLKGFVYGVGHAQTPKT